LDVDTCRFDSLPEEDEDDDDEDVVVGDGEAFRSVAVMVVVAGTAVGRAEAAGGAALVVGGGRTVFTMGTTKGAPVVGTTGNGVPSPSRNRCISPPVCITNVCEMLTEHKASIILEK
jgi:hypothetical protein